MTIGHDRDYGKLRSQCTEDFFNLLNPVLCKNYKEGDIVIHVCDEFSVDRYINTRMIHIYACHGGGFCVFPYIVYETKPWMEFHLQQYDQHDTEIVGVTSILPWIDPKEFVCIDPKKKIRDTFLYMARCLQVKGINFFVDLAKFHPNKIFWIAGGCSSYDEKTKILGVGDGPDIDLSKHPNVKYFGLVDLENRRRLLSFATALIQPSFYFEPCGWNVLEALMSGTPVLVPDFGGFTQTVIHGKVGFLCGPDDWGRFINQIGEINPRECREYAVDKFSEDRAYSEFIEFFDYIMDLNCHNNSKLNFD